MCSRQTHTVILVSVLMLFVMKAYVIYTIMLIFVAVAFMSSLLLLALYLIARVFSNRHPTPQLVVLVVHSHNCPTGTRQRARYRRNSVNLTACNHTQHSPEENDERFCQTVGILKSKT